MRVLFMQSQTYFGADSAVHALLMRYFDRRAVEVHVACNPGTSESPSASLSALSTIPDLAIRPTNFGTSINQRTPKEVVLHAMQHGVPALASLSGLVAYVRKHAIQVIHCTEKPRDAFYGFLVSRLAGARCVIHVHVKAENWISPTVRWAMRHADVLLGVSSFVADSIVQLGYPAGKTRHVLNSLDLTTWKSKTDDGHIRREFAIPSDLPLMAIVSRLFSWKGHGELIRSLALVKKKIADFRLLVVGEDDPRANPGGGAYSSELKALTRDLGLENQVVFTGFRSDVADIMAACDVYTMPSFEEPFGMVYLEAMAMQKPIVALDNGGAKEIVRHGDTGLLSLPKDIEGLAANITTLIENRDLGLRMGKAGRRLLEEEFGPRRMAQQVEEIYRALAQPD
jgi:glycosyltransferase involved in cell wall biosynthesis